MNNNSSSREMGKAGKKRRRATNDGDSYKLGKAGKRRREKEGTTATTETDRWLTRLPEPIIYHILSFLDTKEAVQTWVLSRAWRSAWKNVPVLDLRSQSFRLYPSFQRYVDQVLSLRCPFNVQKMTYIAHGDLEEQDDSQFARVVKYALRHDTQHLAIDVGDVIGYHFHYRFSDLFGSILNCNLRTLELHSITIDNGFRYFGLPRMTTLKLDGCPLSFQQEGNFDLFSKFPCLQSLAIENCFNQLPIHIRRRSLKVSGLQLLSLKLKSMSFRKVEIVAPKLKLLHLSESVEQCSVFSELSLPSVIHADLFLYPASMLNKKKWVERHLISLIQGLQNAKSLTLGSGTIEVLSGLDEFLEQHPSPFTRLKYLNVQSTSIPYRVADYFLKGTSCAEPNMQFVKRSSWNSLMV